MAPQNDKAAGALASGGFLTTGVVLACVGLSTNYWVLENNGRTFSGLWTSCQYEFKIINRSYALSQTANCNAILTRENLLMEGDRIRGTQAMMVLAVISLALAFICNIVYICLKATATHHFLVFVATVASMSSGGLLLVNVLVFAVLRHGTHGRELGWSYALATVACVLSFLATGGLFIEFHNKLQQRIEANRKEAARLQAARSENNSSEERRQRQTASTSYDPYGVRRQAQMDHFITSQARSEHRDDQDQFVRIRREKTTDVQAHGAYENAGAMKSPDPDPEPLHTTVDRSWRRTSRNQSNLTQQREDERSAGNGTAAGVQHTRANTEPTYASVDDSKLDHFITSRSKGSRHESSNHVWSDTTTAEHTTEPKYSTRARARRSNSRADSQAAAGNISSNNTDDGKTHYREDQTTQGITSHTENTPSNRTAGPAWGDSDESRQSHNRSKQTPQLSHFVTEKRRMKDDATEEERYSLPTPDFGAKKSFTPDTDKQYEPPNVAIHGQETSPTSEGSHDNHAYEEIGEFRTRRPRLPPINSLGLQNIKEPEERVIGEPETPKEEEGYEQRGYLQVKGRKKKKKSRNHSDDQEL